MDKCFVIQPFDETYDKRYNDTFKPAIINGELDPYRIDQDLSVRVPIDDIERGIRDSVICFAEITTDNPNVWYELGYAFACGKDVVMICSDERQAKKFPFDIQHRTIINYTTKSVSDFEALKIKITEKIKAYLKSNKFAEKLSASPVVETKGLQSHEIAVLIILMENLFAPYDILAVNAVKREMDKAGYTNIATSVAIRTLSQKQMIEVSTESGFNNENYSVCKLTPLGEDWVLDNQDKLSFRKEKAPAIVVFQEDNTPF